MRLSRRELRVIEVIVGVVSILAAYQTTTLFAVAALNPRGMPLWFAVVEDLLSVGLWVAAYGLLFRGTNWRPQRRYRLPR